MRTTSEAPVAEPQRLIGAPARSSAARAPAPGGDATTPWRRSRSRASRTPSASSTVIERLDLRVQPGEVLGVVGPSGCGKSTLLELISGLREPTAGAIAVGGAGSDSAARLRAAPTCRSATCSCPGSRRSTTPRSRCGTGAPRGARRAAQPTPCSSASGSPASSATRPAELSGGMRQRIAFLRTLLAGKPVLLLDEPFASLDAITRAEMQEWLAEALAAESRTVILVTPRRRGGALPLRPGGRCSRPRPARAVGELAAPAPRARPRTRVGHLGRVHRRARARPGRAVERPAMRRWLPADRDRRRPARRLWSCAASLDVIANALNIEPFLVPAPSEIAQSLWTDRSLLADNGWVTLQEVLGGLRALGRRRRRVRRRPPPLAHAAARLLSAAGRLADGADRRRSRRSWWSGSGSGSARSS